MMMPMDAPDCPEGVFVVVDMQDKFPAALDAALIARIEAHAVEVLARGGSDRLYSARGLMGRVEISLPLCGDGCQGRVRIVP